MTFSYFNFLKLYWKYNMFFLLLVQEQSLTEMNKSLRIKVTIIT